MFSLLSRIRRTTRQQTRFARPKLRWLESRIAPATDIGNTLATSVAALVASFLADNTSITDYLGDGLYPDQDVDVYRIQAQPGLRITAVTSQPSDKGKFDTVLRLFDGKGMQLAINDDYAMGYSRLSYTVQSGLYFFLGISGKGNDAYDPTQLGKGTNNIQGAGDATKGDVILSVDIRGDPTTWISQGPDNVANGQIEGMAGPPANPVIGAIKTVLPDPTNQDRMWVAAVSGGVFRTENAMAASPTWTSLTDDQRSLSMNSLSLDPTDMKANTLLAGIGRTSSLSRIGGELRGLIRSTDGGDTWTSIGAMTFANDNVSAIEARGSLILAATNYGVLGPGAVVVGGANPGLFRSIDGGANFVNLAGLAGSGLPAGAGVYDIVGDYDPIGKIGNLNRFYLASGAGFYRSEDSGKTWITITGPVAAPMILNRGNMRIAIHNTAGKNAVYVIKSDGGNPNANVYRTADRGANWATLDAIPTGKQGNIHLSIAADRASENLVYVGGTAQTLPMVPNAIGATDFTGIISKGDASQPTGMNKQWVAITHNNADPDGAGARPGTAPHADSRSLAFDRAGRLIEGDDGGIYQFSVQAALENASWASLIGTGLRVSEVHSVAYDKINQRFMIGTQDTGTSQQSTVSGGAWTQARGPGLYPAGGLPVAVPDKVGAVDGVRTSVVAVAGFTGVVSDVEVNLSITHPRVSDLKVTLTGPTGVSKTLVTNVAGGGVNFTGTLFDDLAAAAIVTGAAPYTGSFKPEQALNGFAGLAANGNWTLTITDSVIGPGGAANLTGWTLLLGSPLNADGGRVEIQVESPTSIYRYGSTQQYGFMSRTEYDAANNPVGAAQRVARTLGGGGAVTANQFYEPYAASTTTAKALAFAGVAGGNYHVYTSADRGNTATIVNENGGALGLTGINSIAYGGQTPGGPDPVALLVGDNTGLFYFDDTAGAKVLTSAAAPTGVRDLVPDSRNWKTVYFIGTDNSVRGGTTINAAAAYTDYTAAAGKYTGGLSDAGTLRSISFLHGDDTDVVFVSSDRGVYVMQLAAPGVWSKIGFALPNAPGMDMLYSKTAGRELLGLGTLGRGAWSYDNPSVQFDTKLPTTAIALGGPSPASGDVTFNVTFNENVIGVTKNSFTARLSGAGLVGNLDFAPTAVSGSGKNYAVTVNTGAAGATLALLIKPTSGITDVAGNAMGATTASAAFTVDRNLPNATLTLPTITVGGTNYQFDVAYNDDTQIKVNTIGNGNVTVTGPGGALATTLVAGSITPANTDGKPRTAKYQFTPPNGRWSSAANGTYTVAMVGNQVKDNGGAAVPAMQLGKLVVDIGTSLVVDIHGAAATDLDDGNYTPGNLSLREAVKLANANKGVVDSITFNPSIFNVARTITLNAVELAIDDSVFISGISAANVTIDAANNSRIFLVRGFLNNPAISATFENLTLTRGKVVNQSGAAVLSLGNNVTISNCILSNNQSASGGAVASISSGTLVLRNSAITGNMATNGGGLTVDGGTFTIEGCTFSGNMATGTRGGAIQFRNTAQGGRIILRNSTISGNVAAVDGGGISLYLFTGELLVDNSTITNNKATAGLGGGIVVAQDGIITLRSSIVAANTSGTAGPDISEGKLGANTTATNSAIGSKAGIPNIVYPVPSNIAFGTPLLLDTLKNNGGLSQSHLPLASSPLIQAGANPTGLLFDQRGVGFPRQIAGFLPDIGAVEFQSPNLIRGRVYDDRDGNLSFGTGDVGLGGRTVFIDADNNGVLSINAAPVASGAGAVGVIPDGMAAGMDFPVDLSGIAALAGKSIIELVVKLDIAMTALSQLQASLISPTGTKVRLFTNNVNGINMTGTILDDRAALDIFAAPAPFTGSFKPQELLSAFSGLSGTKLAGMWKLNIADTVAGTIAMLNSWSMAITVGERFVTTVAGTGLYQFDEQPAGAATVRTVVPADWTLLDPPGGGHMVVLPPSVAGRDFPQSQGGTVSGLVYDDKNKNGLRDSGEPFIAAATAYLDLNRNAMLDGGEPMAVTGVDGRYQFAKVAAGGYQVRHVLPATYTLITQPAAGFYGITLAAGGAAPGNVFGDFKPKPAPKVDKLKKASTDPNPGTVPVAYSLQFTDLVSTPTAANFAVTPTGTVTFGSVIVSGVGSSYTVSITGVLGTGTLRLDMVNSSGVFDDMTQFVDNVPYLGETYTIAAYDPPPEVLAINFASPEPSTGSTASYTVTFSEPVATPAAVNFTLVPVGGVTGFISSVVGGPLTYTVNLAGIAGDGTLRLDMVNSAGVVDSFNQPLANLPFVGATFTVDTDPPPQVTSIVRASANPTGGPTVNYTVTFSESVVGLAAGNFAVVVGGTATGTVGTVTGGPMVYTVAIAGIGGAGSVRLDMIGSIGVADSALQAVNDLPFAGETYSVTGPTTYIVDEVSDVVDGDFTFGHLSLREALNLTNASVGVADTIGFNAAVFASAQTINLVSGQLSVSDSVVLDGALTGSAFPTIKGAAAASATNNIFHITAGTDTISNLTITGGNITGSGGGVSITAATVVFNNVAIVGNTASVNGGGINISSAAKVTLNGCTIATNSAGPGSITARGGGICLSNGSASATLTAFNSTISGNQSGEDGGGLYFFSGGSLVLDNSTVSGNKADLATPGANGGGGGLYLFNTNATIRNSTISGNSAAKSAGIAILSNNTCTIQNSTIAFNTATTSGGGISRPGAAVVNIESTIVSNNAAPTGPDINGTISKMSFSLVSNPSGLVISSGGSNLLGVSANLAPLANNGGPTLTHLPQPGSPVFNVGSNPASLPVDQRGPGFARVLQGTADIGSVESQSVVATPPKVLSLTINNGAVQRSLVTSVKVTFDQIVTIMAPPESAFQLVRQSDAKVPALVASIDNTGPDTVVTLIFTGSNAVEFGSLADGRYTLSVFASKVSSPGGSLDGNGDGSGGDDYTLISSGGIGVYRLFGDSDGDRDVDNTDFVAFRTAFGGGASIFNSDGDGDTDNTDFVAFRLRFGSMLP